MLPMRLQEERKLACVEVFNREGDNGLGVLVPGNLILTAAHCCTYRVSGEMVLGDVFLHHIITHGGTICAQPWIIEPVMDIAVLGSLDAGAYRTNAEAFEEFCEATSPVPLCYEEFPVFEPFEVAILTPTGEWIMATAAQVRPQVPTLCVESAIPRVGGTSGGPILNLAGELVGLVSQAGTTNEEGATSSGLAPRPHLTLPVWIVQLIQDAASDA